MPPSVTPLRNSLMRAPATQHSAAQLTGMYNNTIQHVVWLGSTCCCVGNALPGAVVPSRLLQLVWQIHPLDTPCTHVWPSEPALSAADPFLDTTCGPCVAKCPQQRTPVNASSTSTLSSCTATSTLPSLLKLRCAKGSGLFCR
jgi:hypothetical protein